MTTEEAIRLIDAMPIDDNEEAISQAWATIKAALARVTARAEQAEKECDLKESTIAVLQGKRLSLTNDLDVSEAKRVKAEKALADATSRAERAERAVAEIHLQITVLPGSREATDLEAFSVRRLRAIDPDGMRWKEVCDDHKAWREFIAITPGPSSPAAANLDAPATGEGGGK